MRDPARLELITSTRDWVVEIYRYTKRFPDDERFGLRSQIRRAAVSVLANIAEGHGRGTQGDFERHLRIASGSLAELRQLLLLTEDLDIASVPEQLLADVGEIGRRLTTLTAKVSSER